jgi:hypothetical protein
MADVEVLDQIHRRWLVNIQTEQHSLETLNRFVPFPKSICPQLYSFPLVLFLLLRVEVGGASFLFIFYLPFVRFGHWIRFSW